MTTAHICMGEYEKAATIAEGALRRYPDTTTFFWDLAISYAHLGRIQEAKSAWEKAFTGWGRSKPDLAMIMVFFPFKSAECAEIVADGFLKAGCPGQPSGYYKICPEHRLTGKEVREMTSGRKHNFLYLNYQFRIDHRNDGKANFEGFGEYYSGTWWIKDDEVCYRWERSDSEDPDSCKNIYRNLDSTPGSKKEYLAIVDWAIFPFSVEKLNSN